MLKDHVSISLCVIDVILTIRFLATTEAQVRKELAAQEERRLRDGGVALNNTAPSAFLVSGLELEDTQ